MATRSPSGTCFAAQIALMLRGPSGMQIPLELAQFPAHRPPQFHAFRMLIDEDKDRERLAQPARRRAPHGVDGLRTQNILIFDGLVEISLAKTQAEASNPGRPSPRSTKRWRIPIGWAMAPSKPNCVRHRATSCSCPLPRFPPRPDEAYRTTMASAKQRGARDFELAPPFAREALPIGPPPDRGARRPRGAQQLSPTPEMPRSAQAQALLLTLAATAKTKSATATAVAAPAAGPATAAR